ncbi:hypothetical protein GCM10009540_26570 [Streptomyces turgidiscabies]
MKYGPARLATGGAALLCPSAVDRQLSAVLELSAALETVNCAGGTQPRLRPSTSAAANVSPVGRSA